VVLPGEAPLALIRQLVELVAPVPFEPEPAHRRVGVAASRLEHVGPPVHLGGVGGFGRRGLRGHGFRIGVVGDGGVEMVGEEVQGRVPERPFVGNVGEEPKGEDVWLEAGHGIHRVATQGGIQHGSALPPLPFTFLHGLVRIGGAARMGREKDGLGDSVVEAD